MDTDAAQSSSTVSPKGALEICDEIMKEMQHSSIQLFYVDRLMQLIEREIDARSSGMVQPRCSYCHQSFLQSSSRCFSLKTDVKKGRSLF